MAGQAESLQVLVSGGELTTRAVFDPWDPRASAPCYLPYYCYLVRHPNGLVLVDCGAHPDLATDPGARLGSQTELAEIVMRPGEDVAGRLREQGLDPRDVRHIVLTHLHYDHVGGLELLPNATAYVQRAERRFAESPPVYQAGWYVPRDWLAHREWRALDGDLDLFGDGSIVLFATPGHTPGHQSVLVRLPRRSILLVGDAAYHPDKMRARRLPAALWNPDAVVASWELLERLQAEHGAELRFSHWPDPTELEASGPITRGRAC